MSALLVGAVLNHLITLLERMGFTVILCKNYHEAVAVLSSTNISVVICKGHLQDGGADELRDWLLATQKRLGFIAASSVVVNDSQEDATSICYNNVNFQKLQRAVTLALKEVGIYLAPRTDPH